MSHWFEYFPGNHMWSQGMMFGIEMQRWGAAAISEIDQVGQKLKGHIGDNDKWWQEWTAMAPSPAADATRERAQGVIVKRTLGVELALRPPGHCFLLRTRPNPSGLEGLLAPSRTGARGPGERRGP